MANLWGNLNDVTGEVSSPFAVIQEQSEFLHEGTDGYLELETTETSRISTNTKKAMESVGIEPQFCYRIDLASQYLDDYSYRLLNLYYDLSFYPCVISVKTKASVELLDELKVVNASQTLTYYVARDVQEFEKILQQVFTCENTTNVMKNLKTLAEEAFEGI